MMIKRSEGLQGTLGLGTAVNHNYDVVHVFYSDLSEGFGNCPYWWVSRTRQAAQACSVCPPSSSGTSALLSPSPEQKQWQVRCTTSSWHTAEVNEVITNSGANRHSPGTPHWDTLMTVRAEVWFGTECFWKDFRHFFNHFSRRWKCNEWFTFVWESVAKCLQYSLYYHVFLELHLCLKVLKN